ncbi:MAG TPA: polysaccharide lyase family 8 super-sandwich domain-containing protein [Bacteroidales bacterium]|nr:polysaccharide lyase family 8 super-sandwich domain-containing protein [Bacteroidales bacterium]
MNHLKMFVTFLFVTFLANGFFNPLYAETNTDVSAVIEQRLRVETIENQLFTSVTSVSSDDLSEAAAYLSSLRLNGSWADVSYTDTDNDWSPVTHLKRMLVLSYAYNKPSSGYYQDATTLKAIQSTIDYWFTVNPTCVNWYKNDITRPTFFSTIGLLMQGKISESSLNKILNVLPSAPIGSTTDRVRSAYSVLHKGVIMKNTGLISLAINGIAATYIQTTNDGIQPDWSYQYHGGILYTGGYGIDLLNYTLLILPLVKDTELDFTAEQMQLLDNFLTKGVCQVVFANQLDYSTMGRQIASSLRNINGFTKYFEFMKTVFPDKSDFYQSMIDGIEHQKRQSITGNTHYWNLDFQVHRSPRYYTSVHMCSNRTIGMECLNYENLKGMWTPFGVNYIFTKGDEYEGIFHVYDWNRLPGVTNPYTLVESASGITQRTIFVGGVSNGKTGIAAMDFSYMNTTAKKAWFFFDKEWVALGAGISSSDAHEVSTTINQCLWKSDIWVDGVPFGRGTRILSKPKWVLQDSVGYVFPNDEMVTLEAEKQTGSHSMIYKFGSTRIEEKEVFTLFIPHGTKPVNETYQYIVVPAIGKDELNTYAGNLPIRILKNTSSVQAVSKPSQGQTEIVFYQPGSLSINDSTTIEVDKPCALIVDQSSLKNEVWISDPSAISSGLTLQMTVRGVKLQQKFDLPIGANAGMSIKSDLKLANNTVEVKINDAYMTQFEIGQYVVHFPEGRYVLKLYDVNGTIVLNRSVIGSKFNLDLEKFVPGLYFVTLKNRKSDYSFKFVKSGI